MGLKDRLGNLKRTANGPRCNLSRLLELLPKEDVEAFWEELPTQRLADRQLAQALNDELAAQRPELEAVGTTIPDFRATDQGIRRHRVGECRSCLP